MKKKSVDILNEADEFEAQLRWLLFKVDQAKVLYPSEDPEIGPVQWQPGIPIYSRPSAYGWRVGQLSIRPMYELIHTSQFHTPEVYYDEPRCWPCEVYWSGSQPCFVCGKERDAYYPGMIAIASIQREMERRYVISSDAIVGRFTASMEEVDRATAGMAEAMRSVRIPRINPIVWQREPVSPRSMRGNDLPDVITTSNPVIRSMPPRNEPIYWYGEIAPATFDFAAWQIANDPDLLPWWNSPAQGEEWVRERRRNLIEFPENFNINAVQNIFPTPVLNTIGYEIEGNVIIHHTTDDGSPTGHLFDALTITHQAMRAQERDWERPVNRSRRDYRG